MRTTRLFQLLDLLRVTTRPVQARILASTLEVSERTIYRDVVTLQAIGAPVRGEPGIGYQLEPGFFLPPLHLSVDEMDAVRCGLRLTAARGDARLREAAEKAAGKIASVLSDGDRMAFLDAPFRAASKMDRRSIDHDDKLARIRSAIKRRAVLDILYLDLKDRRTERTCRPLGLTVFDEVWLLTIWCEMRQGFRNLRIDRIERVESRGKVFRHESGKRFVDYLLTLDSTD
jgi:predicted DNA-binding transcriptional regulator YafY